MKIIEQTPTILEISLSCSNRLNRISNFGFALVCLAMGVLTLWTEKASTLKCSRLEPSQFKCELIASNALQRNTSSIKIRQLQGAKLLTRQGEDIDYNVGLITEYGQTLLTNYYVSSQSNALEKVNLINNFIRNSEQQFLIIQQNTRFIYGSVLLLLSGLILLLLPPMLKLVHSITFDKNLGQVSLVKKNCFQVEVSKIILEDIYRVEVLEIKDSDGGTYYPEVRLLLISGDRIVLSKAFGKSVPSKYHELTQTINQFLDKESSPIPRNPSP